jgi:hypothetical protein
MDKLTSPYHFLSKRRLFLSYAREDHESVAKLYRKLQASGYRPWMDTEDIPPGADWEQEITAAIRNSDYFLACLSSQSIEQKTILKREIQTALDIWRLKSRSDIYLIPVRIEKGDIPPSLAKLQWVDLYELDGWDKLLRALHQGSRRWIRWAVALLIVVLLGLGIRWTLPGPVLTDSALFVSLRPGAGARPVEPAAALIGFTAWELRPSIASDPPRARAIIQPPPKPEQARAEPEEFTPVRLPIQGGLRIGTKFWLGIETSRSGYLYVIDREVFDQGRLGEPFLIFPTERIRQGNNRIASGDLIRLPGDGANPPYWVLESSQADYRGELVTIILTPQPVPELRSQSERAPLDPAWLAGFEKTWGAQAAHVFRGNAGEFAAPAELNPVPVLGRADPPPENIYRVDVKPGRPVVMSVPISIQR